MYRFILVYSFLTLTGISPACAQIQSGFTTRTRVEGSEAVNSLVFFTDSVYGKDIRLVNGRIYQPPHPRAEGHPYFISQEWLGGSVVANGQLFTGLSFQYDISGDHLVYINRSPDGSISRLQLNKEQVWEFSISGHRFVTLDSKEIPTLTHPGYFEALVINRVSLLNKWKKNFEQANVEDYPYGRFSPENKTVYILKEGILMKVRNRSSVLKYLKDKKHELQRYMKENKLKAFHPDDRELTEIVNYYNSIL